MKKGWMVSHPPFLNLVLYKDGCRSRTLSLSGEVLGFGWSSQKLTTEIKQRDKLPLACQEVPTRV